MKTAKQEALDLLAMLPDDATMDVILAELAFKARVEHSHEQAFRGEGMPHEEVVKRLSKWLDPNGLQTRSQA
jgi:predicted transcriptional regulator